MSEKETYLITGVTGSFGVAYTKYLLSNKMDREIILKLLLRAIGTRN